MGSLDDLTGWSKVDKSKAAKRIKQIRESTPSKGVKQIRESTPSRGVPNRVPKVTTPKIEVVGSKPPPATPPKPQPGVLKRPPTVGGGSAYNPTQQVKDIRAAGQQAAKLAEQGKPVTRQLSRAESLARQFGTRVKAKISSWGRSIAKHAKQPRQTLTAAKDVVKHGARAKRAQRVATAGRLAKVGLLAKGAARGIAGRAALTYGYWKVAEAAVPQILSAGAKLKRTHTLQGQAKAGRLKEKALQVKKMQIHSVEAAKVARKRHEAKRK
jgi:hypothetical protein